MFSTSTRTLNVLAALVWITGGIVLLLKVGSLLNEALHLHSGWLWPTASLLVGLVGGGLKSRLIFTKSCHKNLNRIATLPTPRLWQFYSPRFFMFLALMIGAGATLSRLAAGNYVMLLGVSTLDLTIAIALLGSLPVFWQRQAFQPA